MKHFGVDKLCAAKELTMAGIELQEKYAHKWATRHERKTKEKRNKVPYRSNISNADNPTIESDYFHYFVAGYTSGGFSYGITWEEAESLRLMESEVDVSS